MKKTIEGKTYEFVEGCCEDCDFQSNNGCNCPIDLNECIYLNDKNIWKEVTDEKSN